MTEPPPTSGFRLAVLPGGERPRKGLSRRSFLQWLGSASVATLGAGCRPPKDPIAPYGTTPPGVTPGNPRHYATAMALGGFASSLLVTSYEGRPTKIEGNPQHPMNRGSSGVWEQASLLQLYDPARAREILHRGQPIAKATFVQAMQHLGNQLETDGGARLRLLLEPSSSPLLEAAIQRLRERFPNSRIVTWAPTASTSEREGATLALGSPLVPRLDLTRARVIVALDSDFLGMGPEALRLSREFAGHRIDRSSMNRLYSVEPSMTLTGSAADHRFPWRARALWQLPATCSGNSKPSPTDGRTERWPLTCAPSPATSGRTGVRARVIAGDRQPAPVHAAALAINQILDNLGTTVHLYPSQLVAPPSSAEALRHLVEEARSGAVEALITDAFNPLSTLPADLNPGDLFAAVPESIYLSSYTDSTFQAARWAIPSAHPLESWGDVRSPDGTTALTQPLIENLHDSLQLEEVDLGAR